MALNMVHRCNWQIVQYYIQHFDTVISIKPITQLIHVTQNKNCIFPWYLSSTTFSSHFTAALTLGRKVPHSLPPQVELSNPRTTNYIYQPSAGVRHQFRSLIWAVQPKCALEEQRDSGSIVALHRALTAAHIQTTKNNLAWACPYGY